ncbi:MAG: hypothetical protein LUD72_10135 [Bacteroidales bacterium]|nr:hypothetical protein [Bacteroidales bacterium]
MKIVLNITDEHIKLIKNFRTVELTGTRVGINRLSLYQSSFLYEDMADILGYSDKKIPGTNDDYDGPKYDEETTKHLDALADDVERHLVEYEEILHQFCDEGGLKPGRYTAIDSVRVWNYEPFEEEKK